MSSGSGHLYSGYDSDQPSHTHAYLWQPIIHRLASLPAGSKILDAGCGNGSFAKLLQEKNFDVVGMDLDESGIAQARKAFPNIRFEIASVCDDIRTLFGRQFDAVVSLEVVEHLYNPRQFVSRIHDCLRPGGIFVISTPYHGYLKNLSMALAGKLDSHFTALWDGGHIKFWSQKTLTSLLQEKGFKVESFTGAGRFPYFWKSMILVATRV